MGDLLVKIHDLRLPDPEEGIHLKRPLAPERKTVVTWVDKHFGERWASEAEMAFSGHPIRCYVAMNSERELIGFACYDVTFKGFFGPMGVDESCRSQGIGTALMMHCLHSMKESGYAYAIIGGSGADDYYVRTVDAIPIPDSEPGPYQTWIRRE